MVKTRKLFGGKDRRLGAVEEVVIKKWLSSRVQKLWEIIKWLKIR